MASTTTRSSRRLNIESLEIRQVLSASLGTEVSPNLLLIDSPLATSGPTGMTPTQIKAAYGFSSIKFGNVVGDGSGETIAIVDAYNDPNILSDLAKFDAQFGLAAPPSIKVVSQTGGTRLPSNNRGWASEIALDVEWAHAIAPGANILLVEANSSYTSDLNAAEDYARNAAGVVVVSNSWGGGEYNTESSSDVHFTTPSGHAGVTFTVAAGDNGAPAEYPSSSPDVLSVGGTTLRITSNGTWSSESVWSDGGGGTSRYEGTPSYQSALGLSSRGTPDVSYDANPSTGFAVYDSYGSGGWAQFGGTSVGAPQWAALIAIADQGRALSHLGSLSNAQAALYGISRSDFRDITSGSNGYSASSGYDLASGLGSPIANLVVRDLVAYTGSTSFTVSSIASSPVRHRPFFLGGSGFSGFGGFFDEGAGGGLATGSMGGAVAIDSAAPADGSIAASAVESSASDSPVISDSAAAQLAQTSLDGASLDGGLFHRSGDANAVHAAVDAYFATLDGSNIAGQLLSAAVA